MPALIPMASLRSFLASPSFLALLRALPLLPPALRLGRGRLARLPRWRLGLGRASPITEKRPGWALIPPAGAGKSSGAPVGVPPAPSEEEILLTILGVHFELPPIVGADGRYRKVFQH